MDVQIIEEPLKIGIHGLSATARNKEYSGTAFRLSGKVWEIVKRNAVKNKGKNIWVYGVDDNVFAGLELEGDSHEDLTLEFKIIEMSKYAYYKHVGPYRLIKQSGEKMAEEIRRRGFTSSLPYLEIYGHWQADESTLETELITAVI